ncbi:hypothetical protein M011DRAFT_281911 [Sporormia fimetaria CBS 119925]|uniref:Uncharacterized protein n=1 Tax=Sporormia fimetaria CBS 119925 TaxID=1340428 RepID=A0A6A6VH32_9PLEO|nr:hypothetical protein M011DRAFT_281911 [Sporormia fimetaria CBS 119925]
MSSTGKTDTTYKIDALVSPVENTPMLQSPSDNAPEKRFSYNTQKASSKEVVHDAPEVVAGWVPDRKTQSPLYDDDTVVSGYPSPRSFPSPLFEERNASIVSQRHYNAPPERSRICGLRKRSFIALGILIWAILLGVGLGVGLGLGLKKSNKSR